jgi:exodeoxyribonuclease VII small subunit
VTDDLPPDGQTEDLGYAQALDELDEILRELEGSDVDVDRLADRVARAADLIGICRARISSARLRIDGVIADLDAATDLGGADDADSP